MTRIRALAALAAIITALLLQATLVAPLTMPVPISLPALVVAAVALSDGPGAGLSFGFATGLRRRPRVRASGRRARAVVARRRCAVRPRCGRHLHPARRRDRRRRVHRGLGRHGAAAARHALGRHDAAQAVHDVVPTLLGQRAARAGRRAARAPLRCAIRRCARFARLRRSSVDGRDEAAAARRPRAIHDHRGARRVDGADPVRPALLRPTARSEQADADRRPAARRRHRDPRAARVDRRRARAPARRQHDACRC